MTIIRSFIVNHLASGQLWQTTILLHFSSFLMFFEGSTRYMFVFYRNYEVFLISEGVYNFQIQYYQKQQLLVREGDFSLEYPVNKQVSH